MRTAMFFLSTLFFCCHVLVSSTKYEPKECVQYVGKKMSKISYPVARAFFVPQDEVKMLLLGLIYAERAAIKVAAFCLTDDYIAQALVAAHKRGVHVEVVVDASCLSVKSNKVQMLRNAGIYVWVYKKPYSLMHDKYFIFSSCFGRAFVWTGSANATQSGTTRNIENVCLLEDRTLVEQYRYNFEALKTLTKKLQTVARPLPSFGWRDLFGTILENLRVFVL